MKPLTALLRTVEQYLGEGHHETQNPSQRSDPMPSFDWNNLRAFLALVRAGSFRSGGERSGQSAATLSRKLDELEAALGEKLVERMPSGCLVTSAGQRIVAYAEQMEALASEVQRTRDTLRPEDLTGTVRIDADEWVSYFLTKHMPELHSQYPGFNIEILASHRPYSLNLREADISVRAVRPTHGDLVGRRLGRVEFGLYGSVAYVQANQEAIDKQEWDRLSFVGFDDQRAQFATDAWLRSLTRADTAWLRCSYSLGIYVGILAGAGLGVLARFVVDQDSRLMPVVPIISEVTQDLWLTYHTALRGSARIRVSADFIAAQFEKALT
ncbi:LysR family transcriptional regulator [Pseudomonas sp. NPDC090202]|uniref:LysR family transcriptional regulator n=1 Tax=Pseudomonas sp. NPDC090202 TaxID=3364476 RepID=UPI0038017D64